MKASFIIFIFVTLLCLEGIATSESDAIEITETILTTTSGNEFVTTVTSYHNESASFNVVVNIKDRFGTELNRSDSDIFFDLRENVFVIYLPKENGCVLSEIPASWDKHFLLQSLYESFHGSKLLPKIDCITQFSENVDWSQYNPAIKDMCSMRPIIRFIMCTNEEQIEAQEQTIVNALGDDCFFIGYFLDSSQTSASLGCLRIAYNANNLVSGSLRLPNNNNKSDSFVITLFQAPKKELVAFIYLPVVHEANDRLLQRKYGAFLEVTDKRNTLVSAVGENITGQCAIGSQFPDGKKGSAIIKDFEKTNEVDLFYYKCKEEVLRDVGSYNRKIFSNLCEETSVMSLNNCTKISITDSEGMHCNFLGLDYSTENKTKIACYMMN